MLPSKEELCSRAKRELLSSIEAKHALLRDENFFSQLDFLTRKVVSCVNSGHKVILFGNGGSAADAQHISAEFVSRFRFNRPALASIALTVDTSALTAIGNDYGFEFVFSRQIEAVGSSGDVAIGLTTSGKSANVINGLRSAVSRQLSCFAFCGSNGLVDPVREEITSICVPSESTARIQECHITIGHIVCGLVEDIVYGS